MPQARDGEQHGETRNVVISEHNKTRDWVSNTVVGSEKRIIDAIYNAAGIPEDEETKREAEQFWKDFAKDTEAAGEAASVAAAASGSAAVAASGSAAAASGRYQLVVSSS